MSIRQRASRGSVTAGRAALRLSNGLLFLGGGLLRLADFKQATAHYFDEYNSAPSDVAAGLNPFESRMYERAVKPGARVCVIGCGTGRDLLPFVANGHAVVGIEPARGAVRILRELLARQGGAADIIEGFAEDVVLPGRFDAFIFSPHCYSYIHGAAARVALLEKLRAHLNPGGRIAINFLHRRSDWSRTGVRIAAAAARLTGSDCSWEPHDIVTCTAGTMMFEHFFLPDELHAEAGRAGLRLIDAEMDPFLGPISIVGV